MMENNRITNILKSLFWILLIILPIFLIWILFGEINILGLNWIVSFNGKWYGENQITGEINFWVWNGENIFNPLFLLFPFILIPFNILIFFMLYKNKIFQMNQFNSWFSFLLTGFIFIISALIGNEWWHIIIRILVVILTLAILFFALNFITNKIIFNSKNKYNFLSTIIKKEEEEKKYHEELENLKIYKKEKENSDVSSIIIEDT